MWGHAPVLASDQGRVHSQDFSFRDRKIESSRSTPSGQARHACLSGAIAFGAALTLLVGALQSHGQGAGAAIESLIAPTSDFTEPEPGEAKPGGGATSRGSTSTANAFSLSSGNMDFKRELEFKVGNGIFRKTWVSAPSSTDASDGLGPLFNSRACQNCHLKDGRGHPQLSPEIPDDSGSMLVRLSVPAATKEEKERLASHRGERDSRSDLWGPAPGLRRSRHGGGGQAQDRIQGAPSGARRRRDRLSARAVIHAHRSRLWSDQSRNHAFAAGRPTDDRPWAARGRTRGRDPRQRRARRHAQGWRLRQAQSRLVARARQGDARPLRLEGGRSHHRATDRRGVQRRYRSLDRHDPAWLGRLHRDTERMLAGAERQLAKIPECRGGRRAVQARHLLRAEPRRACTAQSRRSRGVEG